MSTSIIPYDEIEKWRGWTLPAIRIGLCHLTDQRSALLTVQVSIICSMLIIRDCVQGREASRIEQ